MGEPLFICPSCGKAKPLSEFGEREVDGVKRRQEWCRECRKNPPKKPAAPEPKK